MNTVSDFSKSTGEANTIRGVPQNTASNVTDTLKKGANDMQRKASDIKNDLSEQASDMGAAVSEKLKNYGVDTDVIAESVKEQASSLQNTLNEHVRSNPGRSLALAALAGFVFALMSKR
jgi:ElaB/YqjD/DUF883 family membrane-anchored ribosome-binding protein